MNVFQIKKGRDILISGQAQDRIENAWTSSAVGIVPQDFCVLSPRVLVKEGDAVKKGTPVLEDKKVPEIKIVSPISGTVKEIRRGDKRKLLAVVIESDGAHNFEQMLKFSPAQIASLSREQIVDQLLATGSWALIRQRPFEKIPHPKHLPKSIFVRAMNTDPLADNVALTLAERGQDFQTGLNVLQKLTDGKVFLCVSSDETAELLINAEGVEVVGFKGPHPAGNAGTHIACLDPLDKGESVWIVNAQDVAAIGQSVLTGQFSAERIVAVAGEGVQEPVYKRTVIGIRISDIVHQPFDGLRVISGSILSGRDAGADGFLGFYDTQISIIPAGGTREFMGWLMPGLIKQSFTRTFLSAFLKHNIALPVDTDTNGSDRTIVMNTFYDQYVALDVMTFFLVKAILAKDIDEAERLGILECAPQDFALAAYACPSKTDLCGIIRDGLDMIAQEEE